MEYTDLASSRQCVLCQSAKVSRWVHFYYQEFLPRQGERASWKFVHWPVAQVHKRNPGALPFTPVFTLTTEAGTSPGCRAFGGTDLMQTQPWRHPGLLTMNVIIAATPSLHTKPKKQLSWVKKPGEKHRIVTNLKAQLRLLASFFREKPTREISSPWLHAAKRNSAHLVRWTIPERTPGRMTPLLLSAAPSSLSLPGLRADFVKGAKSFTLFLSVPGVPCSPGLTLDLQLCLDFATGWWFTPPPFSNAPRLHCPRSLELPDFSAWYDTVTVSDPVSSQVQLYPEIFKAPKLCFQQTCPTVLSPFISQNPLPLATLLTCFYADDTFCHFGKCKQINNAFFPHLLSLSVRKCRRKGRGRARETEPGQSIVRNSLKLKSKCFSPNSRSESWVPDLEFRWRSLSAGLAGGHVILICFRHSNSKLKQLAERRQAGNQ